MRLSLLFIALSGCIGSIETVTGPDGGTLEKFSFFVTSYAGLQELSGSENGFGGDLRYGETGAGAGLRGAAKICNALAERSMPGASAKKFRAFLSVSADENGTQVNAIDRIGDGPWFDRLGRTVALTKAAVLLDRPDADLAIKNDLPNEDGVPNHSPNGVEVDDHDTMTGSSTAGTLSGGTCSDWTSTSSSSKGPLCGHSWPRAHGGNDDAINWLSAHAVPGCAAGATLTDIGGGRGSTTVGGAGGYGGFYCFALIP